MRQIANFKHNRVHRERVGDGGIGTQGLYKRVQIVLARKELNTASRARPKTVGVRGFPKHEAEASLIRPPLLKTERIFALVVHPYLKRERTSFHNRGAKCIIV